MIEASLSKMASEIAPTEDFASSIPARVTFASIVESAAYLHRKIRSATANGTTSHASRIATGTTR